jgi:hypothetical protein
MSFNVWVNQGTVVPAVSSDSPEQPNVLFETGSIIIGGGSPVFKMWFTTGAAGSPVGINYAESSNGTSWTRYSSNPVIASMWGARIFKNSGTYYLYCSSQVFSTAIEAYTSTDGVTWTLQNASAITTSVSGFDSVAVGQLSVLGIIGGTWYGYYWGINSEATQNYQPGLATSTDGIHWSKGSNNPIASLTSGTLANGQSWNSAFGGFFSTVNGAYYMWSQLVTNSYPGATAPLPSDLMRWFATNPSGPWVGLGVLSYNRTLSDEGEGSGAGQVADPSLVADGSGNLWLYYTAVANGNAGSGYVINAAEATSLTFSQLVKTYEGIQGIPLSGNPSLNFNVLASDNFTRANANPIGGNWSPLVAGQTAQLLSNAVTSATAGTEGDSYWNALSWPNDQWSQVTVGLNTSGSFVGVNVRMNTSGVKTTYRFIIEGATGSSGTYLLHKAISGTFTTLATGTLTVNVGDTLTLAVVGTQLSCYWNGLLINTVVDSSISSGAAGFEVDAVTSVTNANLTAWSGGSFQTSPSPPGPSLNNWVSRHRAFANKRFLPTKSGF